MTALSPATVSPTTGAPSSPAAIIPTDHLFRLTTAQYGRMIEAGVLGESDPVELLDGFLVEHMSRNESHDSRLSHITRMLRSMLPKEWMDRGQMALNLSESIPEPDLCIVRFDPDDYSTRAPGVSELGLVIEVADTSLRLDLTTKAQIYARENVPVYWVVNIPDRVVEVLTLPSPGGYLSRQAIAPGTSLPLVLDGQLAGSLDVTELFR